MMNEDTRAKKTREKKITRQIACHGLCENLLDLINKIYDVVKKNVPMTINKETNLSK